MSNPYEQPLGLHDFLSQCGAGIITMIGATRHFNEFVKSLHRADPFWEPELRASLTNGRGIRPSLFGIGFQTGMSDWSNYVLEALFGSTDVERLPQEARAAVDVIVAHNMNQFIERAYTQIGERKPVNVMFLDSTGDDK